MSEATIPFNAPFHVENDEDTFENWLIVDGEGGLVAIIPKGPTEEIKERQWHVALSLAAAPELLQVARQVEYELANRGPDAWFPPHVRIALKAAIAKAEGR